jgi:hypothetical protein
VTKRKYQIEHVREEVEVDEEASKDDTSTAVRGIDKCQERNSRVRSTHFKESFGLKKARATMRSQFEYTHSSALDLAM